MPRKKNGAKEKAILNQMGAKTATISAGVTAAAATREVRGETASATEIAVVSKAASKVKAVAAASAESEINAGAQATARIVTTGVTVAVATVKTFEKGKTGVLAKVRVREDAIAARDGLMTALEVTASRNVASETTGIPEATGLSTVGATADLTVAVAREVSSDATAEIAATAVTTDVPVLLNPSADKVPPDVPATSTFPPP
ncbi:hypothetical protein [Mobiluncus porci]|uniref:Uncharacterized protein n=1 Tax=Mobiluncus porci TaxID=2652278 RepID=A0A7K0JZP6_9ACTO|nr:hypothetical protein [Mobiluncus porci]MST48716.1 hypothetical protein [Mobiluncus porci]